MRTVTRSGGGLSLSSSADYDAAGRIISETDEAGLTTNYAYSNGGRTVTKTLPSTATEVTDHYADGQVRSVTEAAW